jgi:type IV secretion system protein VirB11
VSALAALQDVRGRETAQRRVGHINRLLGDLVGGLLAEPDVTDIILNPDGRLWVTRLESGSDCVGTMTASQAESLIAAIASTLHIVATRDSPVVEGELLIDGSRFEGVIPPVVAAPAFAIRRKASAVFPFARYVERGQMTGRQRDLIEAAIVRRDNILAVGGTGAGKSTLVNAIIEGIVRLSPQHRIVGIEDTVELQCAAENALFMRATTKVTIRDLLRVAMRMFPTRIIIGEVRGPEALDMLMAWTTGHGGGACTVHSDVSTPRGALTRLETMISLATQSPMQRLIGEAIGLIVCMERTESGHRRVNQIVSVDGFDGTDYHLRTETA